MWLVDLFLEVVHFVCISVTIVAEQYITAHGVWRVRLVYILSHEAAI